MLRSLSLYPLHLPAGQPDRIGLHFFNLRCTVQWSLAPPARYRQLNFNSAQEANRKNPGRRHTHTSGFPFSCSISDCIRFYFAPRSAGSVGLGAGRGGDIDVGGGVEVEVGVIYEGMTRMGGNGSHACIYGIHVGSDLIYTTCISVE